MTTTTERGPAVLGDRYRLGELVGRGGMADVYRATDLSLQRPVAVKMLRASDEDETERARLVGEARMLAGLFHSGLVMVLDAGFEGARPYLVMELVEGPTLAEVCQGDGCDPGRVRDVGRQLAATLAFVHDRGIVHRDVKPANVLLGADGRVRLADFGIARLAGRDTGLTRSGFAMGTVGYVSPEQVRGEAITPASDVYSLGLVLLESLSGSSQYDNSGMEAARARLTRGPAIPDDLPPGWADLLREMTAMRPADRPTAAEVVDRLQALPTRPVPPLRTLTLTQPPPAAPPPGTPALPDRADDSIARHARRLGRRLADTPAHLRAAATAVLALVALLVVAAAVDGSRAAESSNLPADTPAALRAPLADLHEAVDDADALLSERLAAVDEAVAADDPRKVRRAVDALVTDTARARVADKIGGEEADRVMRAAAELVRRTSDPGPGN